ncbi:glycosyltransferase [Ruegeria marina]|uniref:Glycosyltransferase involved in cell wall bisynthesis n=1 Tax=Ruegeria marina TaxID=639004 RepID=A0A1G6T4Y8_9RHOB|nr:glycosyltransferase [Ruegeria marina]SDD24212.1 Glycosyltransferase involved in cell wall bisynthesis [Ruegeria marina]
MTRHLSVIIPAHDEADWIGDCARALLASDPLPEGWRGEAVVVANGCSDDTAARARALADLAAERGWGWTVLELAEGGKLGALNAGDAAAQGPLRAYLDADVRVDPDLMAALVRALDTDTPRYASGTPRLAPALSRITRAYGRFWQTLPFVTTGVPGFGLFAVNAAGRARWQDWPDIISDDTFVRLSFAPAERVRVAPGYDWPMVEGFANLVRVRRRQNAGVAEVAALYPQRLENDGTPRLGVSGLMVRLLRDPVGFAVYAGVSLAVKSPLFRARARWTRGR